MSPSPTTLFIIAFHICTEGGSTPSPTCQRGFVDAIWRTELECRGELGGVLRALEESRRGFGVRVTWKRLPICVKVLVLDGGEV